MKNVNRDYLIEVDAKTAAITPSPKELKFYVTDINTSNIFFRLTINDTNTDFTNAPFQNASDYDLILRVLKPGDKHLETKAELLHKNSNFFVADLKPGFTDTVGIYQCELFIKTKINGNEEISTTDPFEYEVIESIFTYLDAVIESDPEYSPSLIDTLATKDYVNQAIESHYLGNYATRDYVNKAIADIRLVDYATKSYVGQAIKNGLVDYATKEYVEYAITGGVDLTNYATKKYVEQAIANINHEHTHNEYVTDDEFNSALETIANKEHTHDEYITKIPDEYITQTELNKVISDLDFDNLIITNSISLGRKADTTIGQYSVATGNEVTASGIRSHAEGNYTVASGSSSHAEGSNTEASGNISHAEGYHTTASENYSHAEGYYTRASGNTSHAEGSHTIAASASQHIQGKWNIEDAADTYAHIVGNGEANYARSNAYTLDWDGNAWFAGNVTVGADKKELAIQEDVDSVIYDNAELRELITSKADEEHTHSEYLAKTDAEDLVVTNSISLYRKTGTKIGTASTALGVDTTASGLCSHAEGNETIASDIASHAEGDNSKATAYASHAEGGYCEASANYSHAEGFSTIAEGKYSHSEGNDSKAAGEASHAEGYGTIATSDYSHVQGCHNVEDTDGIYAHIVGNGSSFFRSNCHTLDWDGNGWYRGNLYVGGTSQSDGNKLATETYVDNAVSNAGTGGGASYPSVNENFNGGEFDNNFDYYISNDIGQHTFTLPDVNTFTEKRSYIRNEGGSIRINNTHLHKLCFRWYVDGDYNYSNSDSTIYTYELPEDGIYELIFTYYPHEGGVWIIRIERLTDKFWETDTGGDTDWPTGGGV